MLYYCSPVCGWPGENWCRAIHSQNNRNNRYRKQAIVRALKSQNSFYARQRSKPIPMIRGIAIIVIVEITFGRKELSSAASILIIRGPS